MGRARSIRSPGSSCCPKGPRPERQVYGVDGAARSAACASRSRHFRPRWPDHGLGREGHRSWQGLTMTAGAAQPAQCVRTRITRSTSAADRRGKPTRCASSRNPHGAGESLHMEEKALTERSRGLGDWTTGRAEGDRGPGGDAPCRADGAARRGRPETRGGCGRHPRPDFDRGGVRFLPRDAPGANSRRSTTHPGRLLDLR